MTGSQLIFFNDLHSTGPPRELILPVIFVAVAAVMAFISDGVARTFQHFEPLEAYKLDLIGSVLGIVGFAVLSFMRMPPVAWGLVAAGVLILVSLPKVAPGDAGGAGDRRGAARHRVGRRQHQLVALLQDRVQPERRRRLLGQRQRGAPPGTRCR